ncbi:DUF4238 domain-containing protein [bacterium]|nr:DUF4238 domain-containing protein [bacterium]
MPKNSQTITQHYVPQFLLRHFSENNKRVWVFDKREQRVFCSNVKNVGAENRFYDFQLNGEDLGMEDALARYESLSSSIIQKIISSESIADISNSDRQILSGFVAIQFLRTRRSRDSYLELASELEKRTQEIIKGNYGIIDKFDVTEEDAKISQIQSLLDFDNLVPLISSKSWLLQKSPPSNPFWLSDHPVVMQNHNDYGPYGNISLAVKGIELYLPLSSGLVLAMLCPSDFNDLKGIEMLPNHLKTPVMKKIELALKTGTPVLCDASNIKNQNHLQVRFSGRYIFSSTNDFSLATKMISDNPKFATGVKIEFL